VSKPQQHIEACFDIIITSWRAVAEDKDVDGWSGSDIEVPEAAL
jgi:hypothetical protein